MIRLRIRFDEALEHISAAYSANQIAKFEDGSYAVILNGESGICAMSETDLAIKLMQDMTGLAWIRSVLSDKVYALPPISELILEFEKNEEIVEFDREANPTAWIYLKDNTSLEIIYEKEGLPPEEQCFAVKRHCSDDDFSNDTYRNTLGIIEQYFGNVDTVFAQIERMVEEYGYSAERKGATYV